MNLIRIQFESFLDHQWSHRKIEDIMMVISNGAPPDWGLDVRAALNTECSGRWNDEEVNATFSKLPRYDFGGFFLWFYQKSSFTSQLWKTFSQLRRHIQNASGIVINAMLTKTYRQSMTWLEYLRDNGGRDWQSTEFKIRWFLLDAIKN